MFDSRSAACLAAIVTALGVIDIDRDSLDSDQWIAASYAKGKNGVRAMLRKEFQHTRVCFFIAHWQDSEP